MRQSTPQQVLEHRSQALGILCLWNLPFSLAGQLLEWTSLTRTRDSPARPPRGVNGFHRLLAEVGLDHVGIILGLELSRLAGVNKDWHQLIELCGSSSERCWRIKTGCTIPRTTTIDYCSVWADHE